MATANPSFSTEIISELDLKRDRENVKSRVDYKSKIQPPLSVCVGGRGMDRVFDPHGVTVDNSTGDIYVAEFNNDCIKVFDSNCKYIFQFGGKVGEGKICYPRCLVIYRDILYISQGPYVSSFCIIKYQLDGRYICRIGTDGEDEMEFTIPYGLTVDKSNGDIYICDTGNERVQILTNALTFKSQFGKDLLSSPLDVKLTEYFIFVMDDSNPCLHLFDYNLILQKSIISKGPGMQVTESYSYSFFIDNSRNILIPDQESNAILIFNPLYELIHKISVNKNPFGITADDEGRIIVIVSCTDWNWLQIF
ncbi:NHL repeat containing protein [Oopsacas minuta]|uniref:NHL repeat containing protein n=1 Tax=Oopsacas minuta TaxID=111878 RepID=A0AAV7JGJ0_9METZ|nr:NHL repeat containing protein [Oopsacas minuta]